MMEKFFLGKYLILVILLLGKLHGNISCVEKERKALLELKKYIISITKEEVDFGLMEYYVLPTWTNDTKSDCCRWEGVACNQTSRRVSEIAFGTLSLKENSLLNISLMHPFEDVRSLNLSKSRFGILYPFEEKGFYEESQNQFSGFFDDVEGYESLGRLRSLEILDLSSNKFNNTIFPFLNAATSLKTLFLRDNYIDGPFPTKGICKLKNMQELDLSRNKLVSSFPSCLTSLSGLRVLDLSSNQMNGELPSSLGNLESLEYLSLFDNNFEGFFSLASLSNLSNLRVLKLGSISNSFRVEYESSWKPKFQLNAIVLNSCNMDQVPHFLLQQKNLRHIDLSGNKISGNFPSWLMENNTELLVLRLQNNHLTSFQLPKSTHGLAFMDVSVNEFNQLFPNNIGLILSQLSYMNISYNSFQGNLPFSLDNMTDIAYLDLSHNNFEGEIPKGLFKNCYSMEHLRLSHNKLSGEIFPEKEVVFFSLLEMLMDNNQFTGKIGQGLRLKSLSVLDISNNNLSGVIPSWIDELSSLSALMLSNNSLEGKIPSSLFNISTLYLLDLSANHFYGDIPPHVRSSMPFVLLLQDNYLSGVIPETLLTNVTVLDLRNNRLSGNIPEFTNIQRIGILLLRGNDLTGHIPRQLCDLKTIHLIDFANNKLNGSIPSCLGNASFGLGKEDALYLLELKSSDMSTSFEVGFALEQDFTSTKGVGRYFNSLLELDPFNGGTTEKSTRTKIEFATKHRYDSYADNNLQLMIGMDLSGNELSGEIPFGLGDLLKLRALNLSHNYLSGEVPNSFSAMKNMESLDLSFNRLHGRIPPQLTELTSLAVFNVSFNNLSGIIPHAKQFYTFDAQSYLGNPLLCGQPTNTNCGSNTNPPPDNVVLKDEESIIDMESFYWSFVVGYVSILLGVFTSLYFDSSWSRFWFDMVDVFIQKMRGLMW
ncbi:unnamed protein product [Cochlearia groenlandica]